MNPIHPEHTQRSLYPEWPLLFYMPYELEIGAVERVLLVSDIHACFKFTIIQKKFSRECIDKTVQQICNPWQLLTIGLQS